MNITTENVILHSLKYANTGELECIKRSGKLVISPSVATFISVLHQKYQNKNNKVFASFSKETQQNQIVKNAVIDEIAGKIDFVSFSQILTNSLLLALKKQGFSEQGVLLISKYTWTTSEYLLIALLQSTDSMTVNENLELQVGHYIDISQIQLVARIDLTLFNRDADCNRYISFIKGRAGRTISDLFLDFLGAIEGFDAKVQNQVLMKAVEDFCDKDTLEVSQKQVVREVVFDYCKDQLKEGEDIEITTLSNQLLERPELGGSFYDFVSEDYNLSPVFPVERTLVRKLTKYTGSGGGISISFDQKHLGDNIHYDPQTDTLVFKGIPDNLREQLKRDAKPIEDE